MAPRLSDEDRQSRGQTRGLPLLVTVICAAIRALIVTMRHLEEQIRRLQADVSRGYSRGIYDGLHHPFAALLTQDRDAP